MILLKLEMNNITESERALTQNYDWAADVMNEASKISEVNWLQTKYGDEEEYSVTDKDQSHEISVTIFRLIFIDFL